MPFLIGTDEAGYGPNLGPLVVTGTLWRVPSLEVDLYQSLKSAVSPTAVPDRITVCDSKQLYQSSGSIAKLETSVLSFLESVPASWRQLIRKLGCARATREEEVWLSDAKLRLPQAAICEQVTSLRNGFLDSCNAAKVELLAIRTATVFPHQFNQEVAARGNKATVLTNTTLNIVNELKRASGGEPLKIICDKHGGRSKYAGVLQHCLTDQLVRIHCESLESSRYSWEEKQRPIQIEFNARGESDLPVALASMVSKYVREVYMKLWNQFWLGHLPELKPTKGYPQDAKRFMADIEAVRNRLSISRESVWRCR